MSDIGFTGTSSNVTARQALALWRVMLKIEVGRGHHGDCINADALFDDMARRLGWVRIAHPGHDGKGDSPHRAGCAADEIRSPLPYLVRNKAIVNEVGRLLACPRGPEQQRGSGTWHTIRLAAKKGIPITIVWPDGTVEERG